MSSPSYPGILAIDDDDEITVNTDTTTTNMSNAATYSDENHSTRSILIDHNDHTEYILDEEDEEQQVQEQVQEHYSDRPSFRDEVVEGEGNPNDNHDNHGNYDDMNDMLDASLDMTTEDDAEIALRIPNYRPTTRRGGNTIGVADNSTGITKQSSSFGMAIIPRTLLGPWCLMGAGVLSVLLGMLILILAVTGNLSSVASLGTSPNQMAAAAAAAPSTPSTNTFSSTGSVLYSEVVDALQDRFWPDLQQALCPAGVPNASKAEHLFGQAREQLGISPEAFLAAKANEPLFQSPHPNWELTYRFFHGQFRDATVYTPNNDSGNNDNGDNDENDENDIDSKDKNKRVAYIPIWEDDNMVIRQWMKDVFNATGVVEDISTEELFRGDENDDSATSNLCIITAIRDPIQHFLLGYNDIEVRRDTVADRDFLPHYYQRPYSTTVERESRFAQFVTDITLEDSKSFGGPLFSRAFSQSRILSELDRVKGGRQSKQSQLLTSYLPSLENLDTIFPDFVQSTCGFLLPSTTSSRLPLLDPTAILKEESSSNKDPEGFYQAAKDVWADKGPVARAMCALHAMDYACWTYLPDGIPPVCQEVYASADFVQAILPR